MKKLYLAALDQGTTSSRAVIFTREGHQVAEAGVEFRQIYPRPGWVEHDPKDILNSQVQAFREAVRQAGIAPEEIAAVGIANQRETTLLWDRESGRCVHPAIVWQCRRSAEQVTRVAEEGACELVRAKTGLTPDAYFSGTKLQWLLENLRLQRAAERGQLCFGTVDSYLAWNLVSGRPHVTDATNAGRTMLYNLHTQDWDEELLSLMRVPREVLPRVIDSAGVVGTLREEIIGAPIPVAALAGDQHAALFGQACLSEGMVKNTYGTGCFMLMNIGDRFRLSGKGLLTTMAWRLNGKTSYALEGSVFTGGAAVQWLRDGLGMIETAAQSEALAAAVPDTGGVYLVPAFTGLGAPHWNMYARGMLVGVTRGTEKGHIVRAALESIAYQSRDLLEAMAVDAGGRPLSLRVDGGASANELLMQFQADIMGIPIIRPSVSETTALGAALLAGLGTGLFSSAQEAASVWRVDSQYLPKMDTGARERGLQGWRRAVRAALSWASNGETAP